MGDMIDTKTFLREVARAEKAEAALDEAIKQTATMSDEMGEAEGECEKLREMCAGLVQIAQDYADECSTCGGDGIWAPRIFEDDVFVGHETPRRCPDCKQARALLAEIDKEETTTATAPPTFTVADAETFICMSPGGALVVESYFTKHFAGDLSLLRACCEDSLRECDGWREEIVWPRVIEDYRAAMASRGEEGAKA